MGDTELEMDMEDLSSAEDFLDYFEIEYDQKVVHVNRLHILQRFHDRINAAGELPEGEDELRTFYTSLLQQSYEDFVTSDALTEKVFKVFRMHEPQQTFVPLGDLKL